MIAGIVTSLIDDSSNMRSHEFYQPYWNNVGINKPWLTTWWAPIKNSVTDLIPCYSNGRARIRQSRNDIVAVRGMEGHGKRSVPACLWSEMGCVFSLPGIRQKWGPSRRLTVRCEEKLTICRSSSQGNHWFSTPVFVRPRAFAFCAPLKQIPVGQRTTVCRCSRLIAGHQRLLSIVLCALQNTVNDGKYWVKWCWWCVGVLVSTCFNYSVSIVFWTSAIQMMIQQDYETVKLT